MLRSMTGFGQKRQQINGVDYVAEVRSVNGRYFKAAIRLPEAWTYLEPEVDQRLRSRLNRGSIQFALRMKAQTADAAYDVNLAAIDRYVEQLDSVRPDQTEVRFTVDMAGLLLAPGVCTPPELQDFCQKAQPEVLRLIDETIEGVIQMRTQEGRSLARDLLNQCAVIGRLLKDIAARAPKVVEEYHRRLKRRVEELLAAGQLKLDEQDLAREVAVFAERCDVSEELSRLGGHLEQFAAAVEKEDQPGRKLDFIAQEMLREANTIASKSNDGAISRAIVEIKTAVDRIKEQVQNVE